MEREKRRKKRKAWWVRRVPTRRVNMKIGHKWERINEEEKVKKKKREK